MIKEMICISCPMGCHLTVDATDKSDIKVTGNTCPRGVTYAKDEILAPKRMVTGSVNVVGSDIAMVSVKTRTAIPKEFIFDSLKLLKGVTLSAPVHIGDVVVADICGTGIDFVATKEIQKI
jgi:CxxC motif-containing protein